MPQRTLRLVTAGLLTASAPLAAAQNDEPLVDVRYQGLGEIQPAEKDAAAHAALMSLGSRIRMLPREIPDFNADRKWIDALWKLATGSGGLMIWEGDDAPLISATIVPLGGTEGMMPALSGMLQDAGGPDFMMNEHGTLGLDTPVGVIQLSEVVGDDGEAIALRLGEAPPASATPLSYELPANSEPVLSMSIELGRLIDIFAELIEDEDPRTFEQIDRFGFLNAGDARLEMAYGSDGNAGFFATRLTGAKPWLGRFFGDGAFTKDDMRAVPRDAVFVTTASADFAWVLEILDAIGEDMGRDFVEQVREGFGIDLDSGLLSNVGPKWIYYQADSTGGGGLLSSVFLVEIRDVEAFKQTQASALIHGNQAGSALGRGYVRSREWQLDGNTVWSAVFPGIPVPIEPSWTIVDGWLIAAATPIGLTSAVGAMNSPESVLDNPLFQQAIGDRWPGDPVVQVSFIDTPRMAARGYGAMSLAASALANAARQPFNANAEPGTVMPAYSVFTDGIRPTGGFVTWDGGDMVQRVSMDASAVVQLAAAISQSGTFLAPQLIAAQAGVLLPALGEARQSARQVKSSVQVRGVVQGAIILHQDNPDADITIDHLLEMGAITEDILISPMGTPWDGGDSIVLREQFGDLDLGSFDAGLIVAMDRTMYVDGWDTVNIGFADGSVQAVPFWEARELMNEPKNAGLREEWGLQD
ncbi:MAG: hypothetical protein AAFR76_02650 [Planctomycetota bacterium]